jgi:hypothetical protein
MLIVALAIATLLWRLHGGLTLSCAMWVLAFAYLHTLPPRLKSLRIPWFSVLVGMLCNALVTVANNGFMPVVGLSRGFIPLLRIWIWQTSGQHLTILADQRALNFCSIGDVFILSGAVLWCVGPLIVAAKARVMVGTSPATTPNGKSLLNPLDN